MQFYRCDGCGKGLKKHELRYTVKIDVRAAYDELEIGLADLIKDHDAEIRALLEQLSHRDPKEVEETVYKLIRLDLCPSCQKAFIKSPLRFHQEQGGVDEELNIDEFLRSLGYGGEGEG
ncbi:MAG: hypothetical protein GHCLOJNM_04541 [bacterium]|nr:hypothetical protein [bacterium]